MFCRQQVAQLRDEVADEVERRGARLIVIGNGTPEHARNFAEEEGVDLDLYVDPEREAYGAAGMKKGVSLGTAVASLKAMRQGHVQTRTRGDAMQNGGVVVLAADGRLLYHQVSQFSGDHADPEAILASLPAVVEPA